MGKQVYNRLYTKEKWAKVNDFNKGALYDYIQECRAQGKSEATIKQYYNDGRIILIYILETLKIRICMILRKEPLEILHYG